MVIHAATIDDDNTTGTGQPGAAYVTLYAGDVDLGTFPVCNDADIAAVVNVCPVMLTHYLVTLRAD